MVKKSAPPKKHKSKGKLLWQHKRWDDPKKAFVAEEVDSPYRNDVIIKDHYGRPISLEVIGVFPSELNIAKRFKNLVASTKEPVLLEAKPMK